jgi:hypothetical protein
MGGRARKGAGTDLVGGGRRRAVVGRGGGGDPQPDPRGLSRSEPGAECVGWVATHFRVRAVRPLFFGLPCGGFRVRACADAAMDGRDANLVGAWAAGRVGCPRPRRGVRGRRGWHWELGTEPEPAGVKKTESKPVSWLRFGWVSSSRPSAILNTFRITSRLTFSKFF